jgi:hypothetical protein
MFPYEVDPGWYEKYWLTERPRPPRRANTGRLARLAVVVALVVGGGAMLSRVHVHNNWGGYQDWEQE